MKLTLGTAQFGLDYGVTNASGQVTPDEVESILALASANDIRTIDTAIAYGNSEKVLGQCDLSNFDVITKIPSLSSQPLSIAELFDGSLERLRIDRLYGLMLHDESDTVASNYTNLRELHRLKEQGLVSKVGGSFYSPELAKKVIESGMVDIVQVPGSILDRRFQESGVMDSALERGVEVHVRSLFLQGLLLVPDEQRPFKLQSHPDLLRFDCAAKVDGNNRLQLTLSYLANNKHIQHGVVGCTSTGQLEQIVDAYHQAKRLTVDSTDLYSNDEQLLNPSLWK